MYEYYDEETPKSPHPPFFGERWKGTKKRTRGQTLEGETPALIPIHQLARVVETTDLGFTLSPNRTNKKRSYRGCRSGYRVQKRECSHSHSHSGTQTVYHHNLLNQRNGESYTGYQTSVCNMLNLF